VTASEWPTPTAGQPLTVTATTDGIIANFDSSTPVVRNHPVLFTNLSHNATAYAWAFGDGHTSHATHPVHTFTQLGPHTVVLTASNFCQSETYSQTLTVRDYAIILIPTAATAEASPGQPVTHTLQLTNAGNFSDTYSLSHLGGQWPTTLLPSETFSLTASAQQEIKVRVTIPSTASVGERDVSTVRVSAASGITANSTLTTSVECVSVGQVSVTYTPTLPTVGEWVTFVGSVWVGSPPLAYTWDFDDGHSGSGPVISHTFPLTATMQTYTTTLTVANACPSHQEAQKAIIVQAHSFYLPVILKKDVTS